MGPLHWRGFAAQPPLGRLRPRDGRGLEAPTRAASSAFSAQAESPRPRAPVPLQRSEPETQCGARHRPGAWLSIGATHRGRPRPSTRARPQEPGHQSQSQHRSQHQSQSQSQHQSQAQHLELEREAESDLERTQTQPDPAGRRTPDPNRRARSKAQKPRPGAQTRTQAQNEPRPRGAREPSSASEAVPWGASWPNQHPPPGSGKADHGRAATRTPEVAGDREPNPTSRLPPSRGTKPQPQCSERDPASP